MIDCKYLDLPREILEKIIEEAIKESERFYKEDNCLRRVERDRYIGSNIMKRISLKG